MRTISKEELNEILIKHQEYLRWGTGSCADLRCTDLIGADLSNVNLRHADLRHADLRGADLYEADLRGAILCGANLHGAELRDANLRGASLSHADLSGASLCEADLDGADLCSVDLCYTDLRGANLRHVNLSNAKNIDQIKWEMDTAFYPMQCPESGSFIGWKQAQGKIVKLEICEDALRSSATSRKCRCSAAKVLAIQYIDGSDYDGMICSDHDKSFVYKVGEIVSVENFDTNRWNECAPGIHFFITRDEAVKY